MCSVWTWFNKIIIYILIIWANLRCRVGVINSLYGFVTVRGRLHQQYCEADKNIDHCGYIERYWKKAVQKLNQITKSVMTVTNLKHAFLCKFTNLMHEIWKENVVVYEEDYSTHFKSILCKTNFALVLVAIGYMLYDVRNNRPKCFRLACSAEYMPII